MHPLIEFSLFNTWILMKVVMIFAPITHPWKKDPITLKSWLKHPSPLLILLSLLITIHGIVSLMNIIILVARM